MVDNPIVQLRFGAEYVCALPDGYTNYVLMNGPVVIVAHPDKQPMFWTKETGWEVLKIKHG